MTSIRLLAMSGFVTVALASATQAQTPGPQALHDALHLAPTQEAPWRTFAAATAPDPDQAARRRSAEAMMPTLSAPRRVDLTIAAMRADLQTMEERGAALKAFYAILTPAQQAAFDEQTAPHSD
ncbi:MAG: Spy/CpxP family protein refolding chaperone [Caulobacterales bacterium]